MRLAFTTTLRVGTSTNPPDPTVIGFSTLRMARSHKRQLCPFNHFDGIIWSVLSTDQLLFSTSTGLLGLRLAASPHTLPTTILTGRSERAITPASMHST